MKQSQFIPAARFNFLTQFFDNLCKIVGLGKKYRESIVKSLNIPNKQIRVMDAGCGTGSLAIEIKKEFRNISLYAVDADSNILVIAEKKAQETKQKINFKKAFLQKLPFPNSSFDIVYSSLVFHHLNNNVKKEAMKEIYRVLKKNGRFLLIDFGKPENKFFSIFSWFTVLFENGYDNYKGKIPRMLSDTGFRKITELGKYRFNISFLESLK